jgi:hypothetical protein
VQASMHMRHNMLVCISSMFDYHATLNLAGTPSYENTVCFFYALHSYRCCGDADRDEDGQAVEA